MKYKKSKTRVSELAGLIPVNNHFDRTKVGEDFKRVLGARPAQAYQWDQIAKALYFSCCSKGSKLIDLEDTEIAFTALRNFKFPSHDTAGRVLKGLATKNKRFTKINKSNNRGPKKYVSNLNPKLTRLNLEILVDRLGLLTPCKPYVLDIDASHIKSKCSEAVYAYEKGQGFYPMLASVNKFPILTEMRSGNAGPHFEIPEFTRVALNALISSFITITHIRMDSAGYKQNVTDFIHGVAKRTFLIGAHMNEKRYKVLDEEAKWNRGTYRTTTFKVSNAWFTSIPYRFEDSKHVHRVVVVAVKGRNPGHKEKAIKEWEKRGDFYFKCILTNDHETREPDLLYLYNQRGNAENVIKNLKDVGIKVLPFSKLNQNHAFIGWQIIMHNIYEHYIRYAHNHNDKIKLNTTIVTFRKRFVVGTVTVKRNVFYFSSSNRIDYKKIV